MGGVFLSPEYTGWTVGDDGCTVQGIPKLKTSNNYFNFYKVQAMYNITQGIFSYLPTCNCPYLSPKLIFNILLLLNNNSLLCIEV